MTNIITNVVSQAAAVHASLPINWTTVISVIMVCLAAMTTLIKIFVSNSNENEQTKLAKDLIDKHENFRKALDEIKTEVEKLKVESANNTKSIEELKKDYKKLIGHLDELLKQILEVL